MSVSSNIRQPLQRLLGAVVSLALLLSHPARIFALGEEYTGITNPSTGFWGQDPESAQTGSLFATMFVYFWNVAIIIGGLIVLVFFIQAAIEWITAGGDSGKLQKARERILQSFIGLAILVFSFVIVNFIGDLLFGTAFSLLQFSIPNPENLVPVQ